MILKESKGNSIQKGVKMLKYKGSSLAQYAIIIALIAIAVVPAFFLIGDTIFSSFTNFYNLLSGGKTNTNVVSSAPETPPTKTETGQKAGSLGGTNDAPVKECSNGSCVIDYGDFLLQGVPDNFSDFVKSSGSSGGTENILSLFDQMIAQTQDSLPAESINKLQELADLGHILAGFEKYVEDIASSCSGKTYANSCFHNIITEPSSYKPDPALLSQFPGLDFSGTIGTVSVHSGRIGGAMHDYLQVPEVFNERKDIELGFAIVERYNQVMQDPSLTNTQKDVVKQLYSQIAILGEEIDAKLWGVSGINEQIIINDPITGIGVMTDVTTFNTEDITNPQSSRITDLDSALICATGKKEDTGTDCK